MFTPFAFVKSAAGFDPDAQAFINATGISGSNATAINTLVLDLKSANIWDKLYAAYPFIGGTAAAHKYNLVDPQDTDAAYRAVFTDCTHNSTGVVFNGTSAFANSFVDFTNVLQDDSHWSFYNTNNVSPYMTSGVYPTGGGFPYQTRRRNESRYHGVEMGAGAGIYAMVNSLEAKTGDEDPAGNLAGWLMGSRISSTQQKVKNNNRTIFTQNENSTTKPANGVKAIIGARNNSDGTGTGINIQASTYTAYYAGWWSIGDGLTDDTMINAYYTAVQDYQTAIGRQV